MKLRTCLLVSVSLGFILCGCGGSVEENSTIDRGASLECPVPTQGETKEETDLKSCGGTCVPAACSHGPCSPEVFLSPTVHISAMAVDPEYLYLGSYGDHVIRRASLQSHAIEDFVTVQGYVQGLAVSGGRLYWTSVPDHQKGGSGEIFAMTLPSGPPVVIAKAHLPRGIGIAKDAVVYADFGTGIWRLPASDGAAKDAATLIAPGDQVAGVWISGDRAFWSAINAYSAVRWVSLLDGHAQGVVACSQEWPNAVTADDQRVYWINSYFPSPSGRVMAWDRSAGGKPKVLFEGVHDKAMALTGDETTLFWSELDEFPSMRIMRMEK